MLARSLLFTAVLFLSVAVWSIVVVIGRSWGYVVAYDLTVSWARWILAVCEKIVGLRYVVEGMENLPSENSVVLLKHSSAYETIAQWVLFPRQTWVLKREVLWTPFLGWAVAGVRPIAINRQAGRRAVEQVVTQGRQRLGEGLWVMIFPEGTRMPPGETRKYGVSGALLAIEAGKLLVPVAHNAGDYWPRRGWLKRPGTVTFRIGKPVDPAGRDPREINAAIQQWIEAEVAAIRSAAASH
ncbi:MAG: 1-acyl-sn-glycerol-3-phosphate acyltransferase [Gammaproteobacteria bacterium]|nr:1-acyl-sn-glycerol-3-phosphate acyltransferase [Gammaproteobacteria bacterium]MCP5139790.1 1-acyl-sn-glycerol-3-phosphate acyltransferase [Chromatiales bacterium]